MGAIFQLRAIPVGDPTLSALEVSTSCARTRHLSVALCGTEVWRIDLFLYYLSLNQLLRDPLRCLHFPSFSLPAFLPIYAIFPFLSYRRFLLSCLLSSLPLILPHPLLPLPFTHFLSLSSLSYRSGVLNIKRTMLS